MKEYEEIKNVFGDEVESYMRFNNVKLVKGDFGGFLVPNTKILKECHKLLKTKYIKKYQITDGPLKENVKLNHKDQSDLPVKDILVCLYDSSKTCQTLNHQSKISKYHIFNTAKNTNDILFDIMNTVIKSNTPVPELLSSFEFYYLNIVLEKFRKNHKRIHYSNLFKKLLKLELENGVKKKYRENKCKYQISQDHLCNILCQIYQIVVPKELFGNNGNGKLLKKAISAIVTAPRNKSINLTKYIMKVNINLISWLKNIYNKDVKYVIVAKVFKWVIVNYLIKVLHSQVCVRHGRHANDRFFILLSDWFKMEKKFIKQNEGNHNLERVSHKQSDIVGKLTFLPKYNSLRPILSLKKYKQEVYKLKDLTRFLQQLYASQVEWQSDNFQNHWKKVQDWKVNRSEKKNIVISSDIASAFDSIKLERLFDILVQLFNKLPEIIFEKTFHLTKKNAYIIKYRKYFIAENLKIPIHSGTLYTGLVSDKARSKTSILKDLHKFIFHQKMDIRNKRYKVKRGVLQGTAPSSILNDIYYSHIFHQYLNVHLKESLFFRQTDDCLLITDNESDAASFIYFIKYGLDKYSCKFNESKTQTNYSLFSGKTVDTVSFLGYDIDVHDLYIAPRYTAHPRYIVSTKVYPSQTLCQALEKKLHCTAFLKLDPCVFSNKTVTVILSNIFQIAQCQAERASILVSHLFNDINSYKDQIIQILLYNNFKLADTILRLLEKNNQEVLNLYKQTVWKKTIRKIIFSEWRKSFKRRNFLRITFSKYL